MSKRDKWEKIVKSKLENFEVDTHPEDWNAILSRLPGKKHVFSLNIWRYAAAAIAVLLLLSGGYFLFSPKEEVPVVAGLQETIINPVQKEEFVATENETIDFSIESEKEDLFKQNKTFPEKLALNQQTVYLKTPGIEVHESENQLITEKLNAEIITIDIDNQLNNIYAEIESIDNASKNSLLAETTQTSVAAKKSTKKRWGFGMGGGSYSVGTDGMNIPDFMSPSYLLSNEAGMLKESANSQNKQDVSHKRPVSFGLGVGYALNDRWSVQSGLYYSMLRSEWWYVNDYQGVSKQKLHFLGIPLGVSYRIVEWNKFNLYASAGGMTEWNFNGRIKTSFYADRQRETVVASKNESIRMKEWQWSVNGKVGISYPLVKFVNAYVEGGANYYFDNGSSIETYRSDKPFHMSLQAGIRLGF